jgi:hypothetical protein
MRVRMHGSDRLTEAHERPQCRELCAERDRFELAVFLPPHPILVQSAPCEVVQVSEVREVTPANELLQTVSVRLYGPIRRVVLSVSQVVVYSGLWCDRFQWLVHVCVSPRIDDKRFSGNALNAR